MTAREKKLAPVVAGLLGVVVVAKFVYPHTIKPLFDVKDEIAQLEDDLLDYQEKADEVDRARLTYKQLVSRTGTTDPALVRTRLLAQLEAMAGEARLNSPRITATKNPSRNRSTGIYTVQMGVAAEGELEAAVRFLKQCYELPYISRFKDVKLEPVKASKKGRKKKDDKGPDLVKLTAGLEVLVLPEHPLAKINVKDIEQPTEHVKHAGEQYAMIWEREPFSEWEVPKPPPPPPPPPNEKEPQTIQKPDRPKTPPRPTDPGDPDRKSKRVAGAVRYGVDELVVVNTRRKTQEYVATGSQLDGGELVLVHPYGGIVRKDSGYYFYGVGDLLQDALPVDKADDYPEIQALAEQLPEIVPTQESAQAGEDETDADPGEEEQVAEAEDAEEPVEPMKPKEDIAKGRKAAGSRGTGATEKKPTSSRLRGASARRGSPNPRDRGDNHVRPGIGC